MPPPLRSLRRLARVVAVLVAMLLAGIPALAIAQSGRISGTVTETGGGALMGVQVLIPAVGLSALTSEGGRFAITGVPVGTHELRVFRVGYKSVNRAGVTVAAGTEAKVEIALDKADVRLQSVVVTASRHAEKITDAAASITAIDPGSLEIMMGNSYFLALKNAPGLDVTQVGITSVFVNSRGFNNRYNTRWLTLEDGRVAVLAEQGLPIGEHTTIPKLDVGSMEVLNGPSSALYGSNASNGLMSITTKDPRQHPGFSTEISGGSRGLFDVQARYAGTTGKWGYKISGERLSANDFTNVIYYPAVTTGGKTLPETIADFHTDVSRVSGALVYYLGEASKVQFNTGYSIRNGLGDSNSGHYQIKDWTYSDYQLLFTNPRWFAQAYITHGNSGNTNQLYANVPTAARNPTLSADSVWELTRFHVDGRIYAAELQNNFLVGSLAKTGISALDNSLVTWGGQARRTRNSSYRTVLLDNVTKAPIETSQTGFYGQVESPLTSTVRTVISGRYDAVSRYPGQFTPRASVLYSPKPDQTIRLTYGEAYRTPPILSTDSYGINGDRKSVV
jgi:outer membrane receptor for ferrienterochelin and colicins